MLKRAAIAINDFWWGEGLADDLPALTYFLLISLAPFVFGVAAVTILVLGDREVAQIITTETYRFMPDDVQDDLLSAVAGAREDSPLILALAIITMLWTASGAVGVIERSLSRMLDRPRPFATIGKLRMLLISGSMVGVIILMITAGVRGTGLVSHSALLGQALGDRMLVAVNVATLLLVITLIYRHVPKGRLDWRAALTGGAVASTGLLLIPTLVGGWLSAQDPSRPRGIFFTFAILVVGCSLVAHSLLIGSGLAARVQRRVELDQRLGRPSWRPRLPRRS